MQTCITCQTRDDSSSFKLEFLKTVCIGNITIVPNYTRIFKKWSNEGHVNISKKFRDTLNLILRRTAICLDALTTTLLICLDRFPSTLRVTPRCLWASTGTILILSVEKHKSTVYMIHTNIMACIYLEHKVYFSCQT